MHTPDSMATEVGLIIAGKRLMARTSLSSLSSVSGVAVNEIRKMESGNFDYLANWPNDENRQTALTKICTALEIDLSSLPGLDGNLY
jgi:hypothetical protein